MTNIAPIITSNKTPTPEEQVVEQPTKRRRLFDRLAIRALPGEVKNDLAETIIDDLNTGVEYRAQMILSVVIAALGLLINSTPVVIGAMLIAPILRPIQWVAFSTVTGNHRLFVRSLGLLMSSVFVWVITGTVMTWLIPFAQSTTEILSRTQPNLLDLVIAMASGVIAFLALGYKKIANSLAGVAMAAALVPPLTVMGIGIALSDISIAQGSLILFATNLIAIIIVGAIVLMMLGFSPNAKKDYRASVQRMFSIIILLALLCVPLIESFITIGRDITTKQTITTSTTSYLETIDPRIRLVSSSYQLSTDAEQSLEIALQLHVPQSIIFTDDQRLELTQLLAQSLDQSVSLQFVIIPTVAVQKITSPLSTPKERIDQMVREYLDREDVGITYIASTYLENEDVYILSLYAPSDEPTISREGEIIKYIRTVDYYPAEIIIDRRQPKTIPTIAEQTAADRLMAEMRQDFTTYVGTAMVLEDTVFDEDVNLFYITIMSYLSSEDTQNILSGRKANFDTGMSLNAQVQYGERIEFHDTY